MPDREEPEPQEPVDRKPEITRRGKFERVSSQDPSTGGSSGVQSPAAASTPGSDRRMLESLSDSDSTPAVTETIAQEPGNIVQNVERGPKPLDHVPKVQPINVFNPEFGAEEVIELQDVVPAPEPEPVVPDLLDVPDAPEMVDSSDDERASYNLAYNINEWFAINVRPRMNDIAERIRSYCPCLRDATTNCIVGSIVMTFVMIMLALAILLILLVHPQSDSNGTGNDGNQNKTVEKLIDVDEE